MKSIIAGAMHIRFIVVAVAIGLMLIGTPLLGGAPIDVFPEFAPPRVEIQTEVPGLSSADVEALVTVPLENAVNGVADLKTLRSKSVLGLSSVVMFFQEGTDLMQARQLVQERLAIVANRLPSVAHPPVILSPLSSTSRVMKIGMSSKTKSQVEMSELARWTIRPRLMAVPGVANVAIWGQRDREVQILVDPHRLQAVNVTLDEVIAAARKAAVVAGGSFIEGPNQRFNVTHVQSITGATDLAGAPVANRNGAVLTLGDVATVTEGTPPPIGDAIINDEPGIMMIVEKHPAGNTLDVSRGVESALGVLRPALEGIDIDSTIFRPATYIENAIFNLNIALLIGSILVIFVLGVFLYDWRTAVVSVVAIPLSLLTAALVISHTGNTINTMVLAGLVIALGEVVDDAIIDVENILRRLRLNVAAGKPRSDFAVILDASFEVRSAVVFGSMIVALVLVPVFLMGGLSGAFFRPLAAAYIIAILASLAVALLVTPALSLLLLPKAAEQRQADAPVVVWLTAKYSAALKSFLDRPKCPLVALGGLGVIALAIFGLSGRELLPSFKEYDFLMHWLERPGTSIDAMNRITIRASKELRGVEGVRNFGAHVGRAEVADEVVGVDFTELWISLDESVSYEAKVQEIQAVVDGYPGLQRDLLTYLRERIKEVLTGSSGAIVVRIFGPDLDGLQREAAKVQKALSSIEGISNLKTQRLTYIPQVEVRFKPEMSTGLGLSPGDVRSVTETMLTGTKVGEIYSHQKIFNIVVRGDERYRTSIDALEEINVTLPGGGVAPLGNVADIYVAPTPNQITREAGSRNIDVSLDASGRSLSAVSADVNAALAELTFEPGYYPVVAGEFVELQAASNRLYLGGLFSIIAIFLILHAHFGSFRITLVSLISLPAALIGGAIAVGLGGAVISLGSLVGFVTALGISARNGIMMISHFRHLETEESVPLSRDLVIRGAIERLRPVTMTTLTTSLALMPIILSGVRPGYEIEHPMAIVIVGGLLTSSLINLFVVPAAYNRWIVSTNQQAYGTAVAS